MKRLTPHSSDQERQRAIESQALAASQSWAQNVPSEGGRVITPPYKPSTFPYSHPGFWAQITGQGQNTGDYGASKNNLPDNRNQYEWVAVLRMKNQHDQVVWIPMDGKTPMPPTVDNGYSSDPYPEAAGSQTASDGTIICPAIEASGSRSVAVGTIVWMWGAEQQPFPDNVDGAAGDKDGNPFRVGESRTFLFSGVGQGVRPFMLVGPSNPFVPCQDTGGVLYMTRTAFVVFVDDPDAANAQEVQVYPAATPEDAQAQAVYERENPGDPNVGDEDPSMSQRRPLRFGVVSLWNPKACGWARWVDRAYQYPEDQGSTAPDSWHGQWQVVDMYDTVIFDAEPIEDINSGSHGTARLFWKPDTGVEIDSNYTIRLSNGGTQPLKANVRLRVYFDRNGYFWAPLTSAASGEVVSFELKDILTYGGSAYVYPWDAINGTDTDPDHTFEVFDSPPFHRGRAYHQFGTEPGSRGTARFNPNSNRWEVLTLQPNATLVRGTVVETSVGPGDMFHINSWLVVEPVGGQIVDQDPNSSTLEVYNAADLIAVAGNKGHFVWDESQDAWVTVFPRPRVKVTTTDTTEGVLNDKIAVDGTWITKETLNGGANEQLKISHTGPGPSYGSPIDTVYSFTKTVGAGGAITLHLQGVNQTWDEVGHLVATDTAMETAIDLPGSNGGLVLVDSSDTTPDYLNGKLVVNDPAITDGDWLSKTTVTGAGGYEYLRVAHVGPGDRSTSQDLPPIYTLGWATDTGGNVGLLVGWNIIYADRYGHKLTTYGNNSTFCQVAGSTYIGVTQPGGVLTISHNLTGNGPQTPGVVTGVTLTGTTVTVNHHTLSVDTAGHVTAYTSTSDTTFNVPQINGPGSTQYSGKVMTGLAITSGKLRITFSDGTTSDVCDVGTC